MAHQGRTLYQDRLTRENLRLNISHWLCFHAKPYTTSLSIGFTAEIIQRLIPLWLCHDGIAAQGYSIGKFYSEPVRNINVNRFALSIRHAFWQTGNKLERVHFMAVSKKSRPMVLPATGYVRRKVLLQNLPFSDATLRRMVADGRFPKPIKLSPRVPAWKVAEVREWIAQRHAESAGSSAP